MQHNKARILLVDNDDASTASLTQSLYDLEYDVIATVSSGERAVFKAEVETPDLIIMPTYVKGSVSSFEIAEVIHSRHRIPVIFISSSNNDEILRKVVESSAMGYLSKPFDKLDLLDMIELALDKSRAIVSSSSIN